MADSQCFLLLTVSGAIWVVWSLFDFSRSIAAENWPTTTGRVIISEIKVSPGYNDKDHYRAVIHYFYEVDNSEYYAYRRCYGDYIGAGWSGFSKRVVARYPPGATVTVYYNPAKPSEAVLEPGPRGPVLRNLAFSLLVAGVGIGGLVFD